jgi:peroxiredoxin (alkyl hydroperoxide reductase subunit C)
MKKKRTLLGALALAALLVCPPAPAPALADHGLKDSIYDPGRLPPRDSVLKVHEGDTAPDFSLPVAGEGGKATRIRLSDYRGRKNVLLSFVPAAWTPVCSDQWPGFNLALELFEAHDTQLLGVSVDNLPSQHAWTLAMQGLDFPVLSDFWPHGAVADSYGLLRSDGMAERALVLIDKQGVIRFIEVHDINTRPDLGTIVRELEKLPKN